MVKGGTALASVRNCAQRALRSAPTARHPAPRKKLVLGELAFPYNLALLFLNVPQAVSWLTATFRSEAGYYEGSSLRPRLEFEGHIFLKPWPIGSVLIVVTG
jgi:hypothetical protein